MLFFWFPASIKGVQRLFAALRSTYMFYVCCCFVSRSQFLLQMGNIQREAVWRPFPGSADLELRSCAETRLGGLGPSSSYTVKRYLRALRLALTGTSVEFGFSSANSLSANSTEAISFVRCLPRSIHSSSLSLRCKYKRGFCRNTQLLCGSSSCLVN